MIYALYVATFVGAIALILLMPRRGYNPRLFGTVIGAMSLGIAWLWLSRAWLAESDTGLPGGALPYYYIFSGIAIIAAVRVITHTKPVYSALWFIMVVLASSGLFLILGADFMAFAMVIIYGGAILVTYVFVIMLAAQAGEEADDDEIASYDKLAREPVAGVIAGAILLALLLTVAFPSGEENAFEPNPQAAALSDQQIIEQTLTNRKSGLLTEEQQANEVLAAAAEEEATTLTNTERVGLDLFQSHPLGLELAGVILLVSLIGAVVIAKMKVEPDNPDQKPITNHQ